MVRGNTAEREAYENAKERYERGETATEPGIDAEHFQAPMTFGSVT